MSEPFKDLIRRETLAPVAGALVAARPGFDGEAFLDAACAGLEALELKARVARVADVLRAHLDPDYASALDHLLAALPPPVPGTDAVTAGMAWWPVLALVERHGLAQPAPSLAALRVLTRSFSAEFAVRPFLAADLEGVLGVLAGWVEDPDPHVRRLVSEGTRPRLPWGMQLPGLRAAPPPTLPLLDALRRDPELYVRRSVANHLGDIAKDHPDLAVAVARRWIEADGTPEARWIARHGLRYPVKRGHAGALAALGFGPARVRDVHLTVRTPAVVLGEAVVVAATLVAEADQALVVDLVLDFPTPAGGVSRKTFKWATPRVAEGATWSAEKRLPLRKVTTRRHAAGPVGVALQVNGLVRATGSFTLALG